MEILIHSMVKGLFQVFKTEIATPCPFRQKWGYFSLQYGESRYL
jgi:hypothetical protein